MATRFTPGCFKYVTVEDLGSLMSESEREICTFNNMVLNTVVAKIQWAAELCDWLHGAGGRHPLPYQREEDTPSQGYPAGASASPQWSIGETFSLASWASSLSDITMIYISSNSEGEQTPSSHSHGSLEQLEPDTDDETATVSPNPDDEDAER